MNDDHDVLMELRGDLKALRAAIEKSERLLTEWRTDQTTRIDQMWGIYLVGRFLIPMLLAMQPVLIVIGIWLIRELSS